jgi:hypothetical protein
LASLPINNSTNTPAMFLYPVPQPLPRVGEPRE